MNEASPRSRTAATISSGSRPGDYTLSVDQRVLDLLRMQAEPRRFTVSAAGDGPGTIDLLLVPR